MIFKKEFPCRKEPKFTGVDLKLIRNKIDLN
jgi:hypothetical protein